MSQDASGIDAATDADVGQQQIATVYAKAIFGAALEAGQVELVIEQLDSLISDVLTAHPALEEILASGLIPADEKAAIIDRVFASQADPLLLNFLKVLADHNRLDCLRSIQQAARGLYKDHRGQVRFRVATATEIDAGLAEKIAQRLKTMLGGEPELELVTQPELIGGIVIRHGDTVYDGSVRTQLKHARNQMINRSIHEIQSGRDRFSHPEGN